MLIRRSIAGLAALAILAVVASGQDQKTPVKLEWKFQKGKPFYQELKTETKQDMKVMGQEVKQSQTQTVYFSWTPTEQDKDKNWIIKQKIEGVKMDIEIGGNRITYDSTATGASNNPLKEFFSALVGSEFTLTLDTKKMEVTKVEGREAFLKSLIGVNAQMEPLLKQILSDEALKQMADPAFAMLPPKDVKVGETWPRKSTLSLGPIGSYENTYEYKYEGKEKDLDKISVKTTLKYTPPVDPAGGAGTGALPFKIKSADLKSKDSKGTIYFDSRPEKGRLDNSKSELTLEGELTIEIGNMTSKVELKQTQTTTVKTTDTNPIAPPKKQ